MTNGRRQGVYWLLTIPSHEWIPSLPDKCAYIKGQAEIGSTTGFAHWQVLAIFIQKASLATVKSIFGRTTHAELSRSEAATEYVWKEDTRVAGTQFEFGTPPLKRNSKTDWDKVWQSAITGDLDSIPSSIRLQHYRTIRTLSADYAAPLAIQRTCKVFVGPTGTGKSKLAWEEATLEAYPKDPRSKFWDGYRGQEHVVIDEFRGGIDISHLLRWLDRYPVLVEIKGSSTVLKAKSIWITSNISPRQWYSELDPDTYDALLRRINVIQF